MNLNNSTIQHRQTDARLPRPTAPAFKLETSNQQQMKSTASPSISSVTLSPLSASHSVSDTVSMLDSRQYASNLRLFTSDSGSAPTATVAECGPRFHQPSMNMAMKEEPDCETVNQQQLGYSFAPEVQSQEMNRPADKFYPLVISQYYMNPTLFSEDQKEKVTAQCRRCGRPVTGWWAPRLVTSNFITHLKSCSMELYQHFLDTKKRCGWASRRYTLKLRAGSASPSPAWNPKRDVAEPMSASRSSELVDLVSPDMAPSSEGQERSNRNDQLLSALAKFAADEVRPLRSLYSGSVQRLLRCVEPQMELPTEDELRQFIGWHQLPIQASTFTQLPPLDQSVVLLSFHGQVTDDPGSSHTICLTAYWSCFISDGTLHKRLFSLRRHCNIKTAFSESLTHLEACREKQQRLSGIETPQLSVSDGIIVISIEPSSYLRLPVSPFYSTSVLRPEVHLKALQRRAGAAKQARRIVDDFSRRLWLIFAAAVEHVDYLPGILRIAFQACPADPSQAQVQPEADLAAVDHLRQLGRAIDALATSGSHLAGVEAEMVRLVPESASDGPRAVLEEVHSAGHYFESALQRLHRPGVTASSRLPLLLGLQKKFGAGPASELRTALVAGLEEALVAEVADTPSGETSLSLLATFADPQYKLFWVDDPSQEERYRDRIVRHLTSRLPKVDESTDSAVASTSSSAPSFSPSGDFCAETGDGLLDFVAKRRRMAISSAGCDWPVLDEVQTYLTNLDEAGPLDFWANTRHQENYPNVYKLHLEVHSVPVSCLDTSQALGIGHELLTGVAVGSEWQCETDEMADSLVMAKFHGYEFEN